jgi:hypothetical protein
MNDPTEKTYDIVDSEGTLIEHDGVPVVDEPAPVPVPVRQTCHLPVVKACGHRLDLHVQPSHRNCEDCWFAFFNTHGELCRQLDEMHMSEGGDSAIIQLQGVKFLHRWRQFMSTIARWKFEQAAEQMKKNNTAPQETNGQA